MSAPDGKPATPFPEMWAAGRAAFFRTAKTYPESVCLVLSAMAGMADILFRLFALGQGAPSPGQLLLWLIGIGPLWGILRNYSLAGGIWIVGGFLGGAGTYRDLRGAVAWASIPMAALLLFILPFALFLGDSFFLLISYAERGAGFALLFAGILLLAALAALIKSFTLLISAVQQQHRFGRSKAIISILGGVLAPAIALAAAVVIIL